MPLGQVRSDWYQYYITGVYCYLSRVQVPAVALCMPWIDGEMHRYHSAQVVMVWDNVRDAGPGPYGLGMAAAFGQTQWLPDMKGPVVFRWEAVDHILLLCA